MNQKINCEKKVGRFFRSPTLDTVKMVESTIKEFSGEFKKTEIWNRLPRKVMWSTFSVVLDYLEEFNRIVLGGDGVITYIWDANGVEKYLKRKAY